MNRRFASAAVVAVIGALILSPASFQVEACGPGFEPDSFVRTNAPDDLGAFAKGQLGILQSGFDSNEYVVAYRYLSGGQLSAKEQEAIYSPGQNPNVLTPEQWTAMQQANKDAQPPNQWLRARSAYMPANASNAAAPSFPTNYEGLVEFDPNYLNCPDPAFRNAVLTLNKRAETWGKQSAWLADWIHGQDTVFSNCAGKAVGMPVAAPAGSPALLRADRAYQLASASLYAKQFDEAARQFAAIAADNDSPWKGWGQYLAARATVRKAFAMGKATDPYSGDLATYDAATMRQAQQMLESLLAQPDPSPARNTVLDELNFIRIRTEPEQRVAEICKAFAGPNADPRFSQDLADLSWILLKHVPIQDPPPLFAWIAAWRGNGTAGLAFATWQNGRALPWLVMAMVKADASDAFVPQLLAAAETIKPGSPAYDTVFYHRVRLLIGLKRGDEARALLDPALAATRNRPPDSYRNALLGERMAVATNFAEFLTYAPRTVLAAGSEGAFDLEGQCNARAHALNKPGDCPQIKQPFAFDEDATQILNQRTPLKLLIEAVNSPAIPQNLRQDLALVAWTRSVMLGDAASAASLAPVLPRPLGPTAETGVGFAASLAILRNPGIRPYLEPGVSRVASYSYFDDLRNNWWCKPWDNMPFDEGSKPRQIPIPAFMTPEQRAQADAEYERLQQLPDSAALIGQRVIDYAKDHSDDAQVPEALALTVRAGHYACQTWTPGASEYTAVSKAAFQLLHRRYPASPWTAKTPYYY